MIASLQKEASSVSRLKLVLYKVSNISNSAAELILIFFIDGVVSSINGAESFLNLSFSLALTLIFNVFVIES